MYKNTRILAIDPGNIESGVVIWDGSNVVFTGVLLNATLNTAILSSIYKYDIALIENLTHQGRAKVGKEVFDTARYIGYLERCFENVNKPYRLISRNDVKMHHCRTSQARDTDIVKALTKKYPKGSVKSPGVTYLVRSHAWQALALATFYSESHTL
jgi:hypothetical protein